MACRARVALAVGEVDDGEGGGGGTTEEEQDLLMAVPAETESAEAIEDNQLEMDEEGLLDMVDINEQQMYQGQMGPSRYGG